MSSWEYRPQGTALAFRTTVSARIVVVVDHVVVDHVVVDLSVPVFRDGSGGSDIHRRAQFPYVIKWKESSRHAAIILGASIRSWFRFRFIDGGEQLVAAAGIRSRFVPVWRASFALDGGGVAGSTDDDNDPWAVVVATVSAASSCSARGSASAPSCGASCDARGGALCGASASGGRALCSASGAVYDHSTGAIASVVTSHGGGASSTAFASVSAFCLGLG